MKSFKEYLAENDYPGAYYTQDMQRMVAHFDNAKEKAEFDADPHNDPNDELIFRSDKRIKGKQAATKAASTVAKYAAPIATTALKTALGDGLLSEIPVEQIENTQQAIQAELTKVNNILIQIKAEYAKTKDLNKKKQLEDKFNHYKDRKEQLSEKWKNYQQQNYS